MDTRNAARNNLVPPDLAALLLQARGGDRLAFRRLVEAFQARIFSVAWRLTGLRADAEELAQDVFVQLHATLPQVNDAAHLERWLLRAVYHRCVDRLRQRDRQGVKLSLEALQDRPEGQVPDSGADPLAACRLQHLLLQLPPDARAVVLLRYQDDLDPVDIAAVLDMPLNTVKSHLRRSLQWLRGRYAGDTDGY